MCRCHGPGLSMGLKPQRLSVPGHKHENDTELTVVTQ
jgi:hypothetical protein